MASNTDDTKLKTAISQVAESSYKKGLEYQATNRLSAAIACFKKAAEERHAEATAQVGHHFLEGLGVRKDLKQALEWLRRASEHGSVTAQYLLGRCYMDGQGVAIDLNTARTHFMKALAYPGGLTEGFLGLSYLGSEFNHLLARTWLQKAAAKGNAQAMYSLGAMTSRGWDGHVPPDRSLALAWFRKAIKAGDIESIQAVKTLEENEKKASSGKKIEEAKRDQLTEAEQYYRNGWRETNANHLEAAFNWFLKAAERGHNEARAEVGTRYMHGKGTRQDQKRGLEYFQLAAEAGNETACCNLAVSYFRGQDVPINKIIRSLKIFADQGSARAQTVLGDFFKRGKGVEQDIKKAFELYNKAAEQNEPNALFNVGFCYETGENVPVDMKKAIEYYRKALNNSQAQYRLGCLYSEGKYVQQDFITAFDLLRLSVAAGCREGMYALAHAYRLGNGVPVNPQEALKWYRCGAAENEPHSQYYLGHCHLEGLLGIPKNNSEALRWLHLAAAQEYLPAIEELGRYHFSVSSARQDLKQAIEWFEKAVKKNSAIGKLNLGFCLMQGLGIESDEKRAVDLLHQAALEGIPHAKWYLAVYYMRGGAAYRNETQAVEWLEKILLDGESDVYSYALTELGVCCLNGRGLRKNEKRAFSLFQQAAYLGSAPAMHSLAVCYFNGTGVVKDNRLALEWCRKAAKNHDGMAILDLGLLQKIEEDEKKQAIEKATYEAARAIEKARFEAERAVERAKFEAAKKEEEFRETIKTFEQQLQIMEKDFDEIKGVFETLAHANRKFSLDSLISNNKLRHERMLKIKKELEDLQPNTDRLDSIKQELNVLQRELEGFFKTHKKKVGIAILERREARLEAKHKVEAERAERALERKKREEETQKKCEEDILKQRELSINTPSVSIRTVDDAPRKLHQEARRPVDPENINRSTSVRTASRQESSFQTQFTTRALIYNPSLPYTPAERELFQEFFGESSRDELGQRNYLQTHCSAFASLAAYEMPNRQKERKEALDINQAKKMFRNGLLFHTAFLMDCLIYMPTVESLGFRRGMVRNLRDYIYHADMDAYFGLGEETLSASVFSNTQTLVKKILDCLTHNLSFPTTTLDGVKTIEDCPLLSAIAGIKREAETGHLMLPRPTLEVCQKHIRFCEQDLRDLKNLEDNPTAFNARFSNSNISLRTLLIEGARKFAIARKGAFLALMRDCYPDFYRGSDYPSIHLGNTVRHAGRMALENTRVAFSHTSVPPVEATPRTPVIVPAFTASQLATATTVVTAAPRAVTTSM